MNNKRRKTKKKADKYRIILPDETLPVGAAATRRQHDGVFQKLKERGVGGLASGPVTCRGRAAIFYQTGTTGDAGLLFCSGGR